MYLILFLKIQERMELTPVEHQIIDHIVAAHQKYTIPLEEAKKFVRVQNGQATYKYIKIVLFNFSYSSSIFW